MNSRLLAVALTVTSLALTASPALAKGGGGGGGGATPPPPPAEPAPVAWALCPEFAEPGFIRLADGSTLLANQVSGVACVVARATPSGGLFLYDIRLADGWASSVKSAGGGNSNRVDVELTNPRTGEKHSILMAPGKTVIR